MKCKNCAKEMTCNKEKCNFISWIQTNNCGEVKRIGEIRTMETKER